jgi:sugar lactone lactonase YvrE
MKINRLTIAACTLLGAGVMVEVCGCKGEKPQPQPARTSQLPSERTIGTIEAVTEFYDAMPAGVTVSRDGRIFVNYPRWGDTVPFTVGEIHNGKVIPYPNQEINTFDQNYPANTLSSVQSVVVDPANRLCILDTATPKFSTPSVGAAKLVAVDLATNQVVKTIVYPASAILSTTYINDVRVELRKGNAGIAYITDSAHDGPGGIIVVDLASGESWRKLSGHPSTVADPSFIPVVEGESLAISSQGKAPLPVKAGADGIAISSDGATLFYCPLSSRHLYSIPTALLLDRSVDSGLKSPARTEPAAALPIYRAFLNRRQFLTIQDQRQLEVACFQRIVNGP